MADEAVLSRHRLPRRYRWSLAMLWLLPLILLLVSLVLSQGLSPALLDLRLLLPLLAMAIPAAYIWQEGVDVLTSGIVARVFWPRYYPYTRLDTWYFDRHPDRRVLTIWDTGGAKALEMRAGHLTDLPLLLKALTARVHYRLPP